MASGTPSGWYPSPDDPSAERWWDGESWTDHTRPRTSTTPAPPSPYSFDASLATKPDSYLAWSILATLFCCLPFGIAAIVQSARVDGLWMSGDVAGAHESSRKALRWIKWSVGLAVGLFVGYVVIVVLAVSFGDSGTSYRYEYP